jgi:chorismate-pyruvate lyase
MLNSYYDKQGVERAYEVFRSHGFSPNWVIGGIKQENVSMETLPAFLRTLLVTDGTVTKSLEAFYWEPVGVETIFQEQIRAEADINWLDIRVGDEVIARRVDLRGRMSQTVYTRAFSVIRPNLIPEVLRAKLIAGSLGIGELIRDCGLETYRELVEIGVTDTIQGPAGGANVEEEHIHRTYRIVLNHQPAILVTEHFPLSAFADAGRRSSS